jgi:hypothetical protein
MGDQEHTTDQPAGESCEGPRRPAALGVANGRRSRAAWRVARRSPARLAAAPVEAVAPPAPLAAYRRLHLPLTAALIRAGLGGLSMGTPGHRGGRLFGAWEATGDSEHR